jgi:hypothetical protein
MYGGVTLLGLLTEGVAGIAPGDMSLNDKQWGLWRAGHAHAGVLVILSLILQPLIDSIELSTGWEWTARLGTPAASILMAGGFFGLAFITAFRWMLYTGAICLVASMLIAGIGLVKSGYSSTLCIYPLTCLYHLMVQNPSGTKSS